MDDQPSAFDNLSAKLVACVVVAACLALGVIGLLLPIVPGLLFLAVGAAVAAKLSPSFAGVLRRNATIAAYLDKTDGFFDLPLGERVRLACLLSLKMLLDGMALLVTGIMRLIKAAERT